MAYKKGTDRDQIPLVSISLEASISEDNPVRVIDAFVDWLDLSALGFTHTVDNTKGTSVYPPSTLLKLYLYGYLNRHRSSRQLAKECERNIELHWLLRRLTPQYHTIADFRKDNAVALKGIFKEFTQLCIAMSLVEGKTIAFDGTRIHAQNSQKNNFNAKRLEKLLARIETKSQAYEQYLTALDEQDKAESVQPNIVVPVGKTKPDIEKTLTLLAQRRLQYEAYQQQLKTAAEQGKPTEELQISTVDPDARAMAFKKNHTEVGYNIQTAGDAKHKLIIHFDVTNVNDNNALSDLAITTKDILHIKEGETYSALADTGYHNGEQLTLCVQANINTFVCPADIGQEQTDLENPKGNLFTKNKFVYDAQSDTYTCPNDQQLKSNGTWYIDKANSRRRKKERKNKHYTIPSKICQQCPFATQCQGNAVIQWHGKTIQRSEYEDAVDTNRKRVLENPNAYKQRKEIIEHPFGTIKRSWGYNYTLLRTKKKVEGEFALIYCAYNLRRLISILGIKDLIIALKSPKYTSSHIFDCFTDFISALFVKPMKISAFHTLRLTQLLPILTISCILNN